MIKKHLLDFQKAKSYFTENLKKTNFLSDSVLFFTRFESGNFFALLKDKKENTDLNEFKTGGKTTCSRDDVSEFILNVLKNDAKLSCIFDDFNADKKNIEDDLLFSSNGVFFEEEVYYLVNNNTTKNLLIQCLRRSNVIWHSLCILSHTQFEEHKKTMNREDVKEICLNAKLIMIGAYDAEGYVIWEKKK